MTQDSVNKVTPSVLMRLEPLSKLSQQRIQELSELCYIEQVKKNLDPFRIRSIEGQLVYLVSGELALKKGNGSVVLVGGSEAAKFPIGKWRDEISFSSAKALTDIELVRIDNDLLDIMLTWDQLVFQENQRHIAEHSPQENSAKFVPELTDWRIMSGVFSANNLKQGVFSQLPVAHIAELLSRFNRVAVSRGEVIIKEGEEGDYYYLIENGRCEVTRVVGGVTVILAYLKSGDAFGEEALVSDAKRNATVTMKTDGVLLKLNKKDFIALLKEPLLTQVSYKQAQEKIAEGAVWMDVRYPSEYQYDCLPNAINIPLNEVRNAIGLLDRNTPYIVYCQSGRRSSAAAFLLAQAGYEVCLLENGYGEKTFKITPC